MAFEDRAALAGDPQFRDRVIVAALQTAVGILATEPPVGQEEYVERRQALATAVFNTPREMTDRFAWAVISNPGIGPAATDSDIEYTITTVWDPLSGIPAQDRP